MSDDDDDFYMVLPSNGCADTHPENEANKFTISWEQPLSLGVDKWKVALTEANFSYTMTSINTSFGIKYDKVKIEDLEFRALISGNFETRHVRMTFPDIPENREETWFRVRNRLYESGSFTTPTVYFLRDDVFVESTTPFLIEIDESRWVTHPKSKKFRILIPKRYLTRRKIMKTAGIDFECPVAFRYMTLPTIKSHEVFAQEEVFWANTDEMVDGLKVIFKDVFEKVELIDGKLKLWVGKGITKVQFLSGLNICLGFTKRIYGAIAPNGYIMAEGVPYLRHGINTMYIYSSICQPIRVGSVCVPLLKSVWLEPNRNNGNNQSHAFGEVCNIVIKNPMYLPLSSTSINAIEVNIRSDSGRLIPFIGGSITSLTLHFKRQRRRRH